MIVKDKSSGSNSSDDKEDDNKGEADTYAKGQ